MYCTPRHQRDSHPIRVAGDSGIEALQKAANFPHALHRNELHAILVLQYLHFPAGLKAERLTTLARNHDWELA